jgi:putative flippase GtrA
VPRRSHAAAAGTLRQACRYALVGLGSNLLLYLAYLALTGAGFEHKLAMTLVFSSGAAITFVVNGRWSFGARGLGVASLGRYVAAYGMGYLLNLSLLWLFVDRWGLPHAPVQGVLILGVAAFLFVVHKVWVFRAPAAEPAVPDGTGSR